MKDTTKAILIMMAILATTGMILNWSISNDKKVEQSAERYEKCINEEYGMTPRELQEIIGEMPRCAE